VRRATARVLDGDGFRWFEIPQLSGIPFSTTARKALRLAGIVYKL